MNKINLYANFSSPLKIPTSSTSKINLKKDFQNYFITKSLRSESMFGFAIVRVWSFQIYILCEYP